MNTINHRIAHFVESLGISPNAFGKSIGLENSGTIYNIVKGTQQDISSRILSMIADAYPNLNMHWVITGKGNMLIDGPAVSPDVETRLSRLEQEFKKLQCIIN